MVSFAYVYTIICTLTELLILCQLMRSKEAATYFIRILYLFDLLTELFSFVNFKRSLCMSFVRAYFPHILFVLYLILMIWLGIDPYSRETWFAENLPIWIVVAGLALSFPKFRFSNTAYFLMWFFLCFHTIGGHYSFSRVPFDFFNDLIGSERNNFDRVGHFLVGVFAYPMAELYQRKKWVSNTATAVLIGILAVGTWAGFYEVVEMIYAVNYGGEQAADFLGSQGDIWDAQKDIAMDLLGGTLFGLIYLYFHRD